MGAREPSGPGQAPRREAEHHYGSRVHLLEDPWTSSVLARIASPEIGHADLLALVRSTYGLLAGAALAAELPTVETTLPTRMAQTHPEAGQWRGRVLDPASSVVIIDVIRGGIVPAQVCFETLASVLPMDALRLDHLNMARIAGSDGHVAGVDLSGSKVGGSTVGATVIIPDPMGATGSTTRVAIEHLREHHGQAAKWVLMPMICTPEYLRLVLDLDPDVSVWTTRIDRGLSPPEVLESPPGLHWERERGLDNQDYIVPGAGGVGEVLNNSWC